MSENASMPFSPARLARNPMNISAPIRSHARHLFNFLDQSPSPWHVVAGMEKLLAEHNFQALDETRTWSIQPGGAYWVMRGGSSLIAFRVGSGWLGEQGFRIVGAHTDSPGFRLKPSAEHEAEKMSCMGVEIYGSPILASFTDRDLSLAGRVCFRHDDGIKTSLLHFHRSLVRLPNLALHMNRSVNEDGLKLDKQTQTPLLLASMLAEEADSGRFLRTVAERCGCTAEDLLSWEFNVFDNQKAAIWGLDGEYFASGRIDNLASCHAGLTALLETNAGRHVSVAAFFDHEEVGSESYKGAMGSFLSDVLERIVSGLGVETPIYRQALARSFLVSADAAHAHHPNHARMYEPQHPVRVNLGPAIKINCNQRYATDAVTEARFARICELAGIPYQKYVHRTDLACGSTIGPMTAARLGVATVDVGCPMWAMHSARESAGVLDQFWFCQALKTFFSLEELPSVTSAKK